jgi:ectoine hydroxylase
LNVVLKKVKCHTALNHCGWENFMNRVTPQTPLNEVLELMQRDGYVLMENALDANEVAALSAAYDEQLALHPPKEGALRAEIPRIIERDPRFEMLMDHAPTFRVARAILGYDIDLASGGELDHKLPRTPAYISWHSDFQWMATVAPPRPNFWIRCTYFLSDVNEDTGPFTLLPGSHNRAEVCPEDAPGTPPRYIEGQLGITGPAGSCLINNTEIWHTNSPNNGDLPRRLIMILYKHAWMKPWQEGYEVSPEFAARQTDPLRQQLCGAISWHQEKTKFPAYSL